ncbi:hypothetical protein WJX73_008307 [Symbiochloris irregularis]|uniref:PH domain-containing protein n=1 Tax=Symbiochloris irregularis TaxID=706552 RepID=A0AAW1PZA5_9CHLO
MFEGQLAYYLNRYLGTYVNGLDPQSLKVSVFSGDVVLNNLQLKPTALAELNLPVSVKSGLLGRLTLKVPWRSLGRSPVIVEMDRLFILAGPKQEAAEDMDVDDEENDDIDQVVKRRRVESAEASWAASASKLDQDAEGAPRPGRFQAIIDTVLGNIQLVVSNIHVRYEDDTSNPDMPFAVGFTLERLSAHTVDEQGEKAFVTNNPMDFLRKASELRRLALYFDVGIDLWKTEQSWEDMQPQEWDELFLPSIAAPEEGSQQGLVPHTYVLKPIDGQTTYLRRSAKARSGDDEAVQQADVSLDAVSLHLSRPQYLSVHSLLDELSAFSARRANMHLRPASRPRAGASARRWWRYAIRSASKESRSTFLTWTQLHKVMQARKQYVPLYIDCLHNDQQGGDEQIAEMDKELPEVTILVFRRLAHARVEREKRAQAAKAAAEARARKQQSWLGWLTGAGAGSAEPADDDSDLRGDLNQEEYAKLQELVDERDAAIQAGAASPKSVQMEVRVRMSSSAIVLDGDSETGAAPILRAGTRGTTAVLRKYPKTTSVRVAVAGMGVSTPDGPIVHTGALLLPSSSILKDDGDEGWQAEGSHAKARNALEVELVQAPQDGSADTTINLALAPSFITYHASTVQRLQDMFHTEQVVDLSALGAQAIAQVERARRQAAAQLSAVMQNRPKLKLHAQLDGPKIAVPISASSTGEGQLALVVDTGSCVIESDTDALNKLPADEAALYECIKLRIRDVSAYAVDGHFSFSALAKAAGGKQDSEPAEEAAEEVTQEITEAIRQDDGVALGGQALFIPLLQRCGTEASIQALRFPDPSHVPLRASLSVSSLRFCFSPGRARRIMRILRAAIPGGKAGPDDPRKGQEPWRLQAEMHSQLRVLEWGVAHASASWVKRWVYLHRGWLYCLERRSSQQELSSHNIWLDRRAVRIPESVAGKPHVIGVLPESLEVAKAAENSDCLLLRCANEEEADKWLEHLMRSQQAMRLLAGPLGDSQILDQGSGDDNTSVAGSTEASQEASQTVGTGAAQPKISLSARLGEVALFVSGRAAPVWWPAEESLAETGERPIAAPSPSEGSGAADMVNVDGETSLIVIRASGGQATAEMADDHLTAGVVVGAFEIEDLLVGARCPTLSYLARSFETDEGGHGDQQFKDASDRLAHVSTDSTQLQDFEDADGPSELSQEPHRAWVMQFDTWKPSSPDYANVDSELHMQLTKLYFFCNRPTIGALMGLGTDLGDAFKDPDSAGTPDASQEQIDNAARMERTESMVSEVGYEADSSLARKGGDERTTFRLSLKVQQLQAALNYEAGDAPALALTSIDDMDLSLDIHPRSMGLSATLGNLRAQDGTLEEDHPYRNVCGVRQDASASLVKLRFDMFPPLEEDAAKQQGVPVGLPYSRLQAQMAQLEVVFLSRFVFELLRYINLLLRLRPAPLNGADADSSEAQRSKEHLGADQQSQGQGLQDRPPFVLLMDLHMDAPIITMPRQSDSSDNVKVDLGSIHLGNQVVWHTGESPTDPEAVLLEQDQIKLSDLRAEVSAEGHKGGNIIREYNDGMRLHLHRPLLDRAERLPAMSVAMDLPSIKASLSDKEYSLMVAIAGANLGEEQRVPSGAAWLEDTLAAEQEQEKQDAAQSEPQQSMAERAGTLAKTLYQVDAETAVPEGEPMEDEQLQQGISQSSAPDRIAVRVAINIGKTELELLRTSNEATGDLAPLGRFTLRNLWVVFTSTRTRKLALRLSMPWVEGEDTRPWVPKEHSLVISSADAAADGARTPASLLTLQYAAEADLARQKIEVRLQRPTVSAEMSFMLAVTSFFVPGFALGGITPSPFQSYDLLLTGDHKAEGDLWLCPEVRLLADSPSTPDNIVYDGCGHRMVLPPDVAPDDPVPLILVGPGRTLTLKNTRIVQASSLPACLQLGPGAQMLARPEDLVEMLQGADADLEAQHERSLYYSGSMSRSSFMGRSSMSFSKRNNSPLNKNSMSLAQKRGQGVTKSPASPARPQEQGSRGAARSPQASPAQPKAVESAIEMDIVAVGVGLRFLELDPSAQILWANVHGTGDKEPEDASGNSQALRMLAAYLDASAHVEMQGETRALKAQVQGLRVETRVDLGGIAGEAPQANRVQGTVLEPCCIGADIKMYPGGKGDCELTLSDLRLNVSADLIELAQNLERNVLGPLAFPSPDKPIAMCSRFARQWASYVESAGSEPMVNTHTLGSERGLTFWRPQPPVGYAMTGDCAVPGSAQPTFQVVAIAINSGFVTFPIAYTAVYSRRGLTVWRPTPPEGYCALGCLVTTSSDPANRPPEEPALADMVCIHEHIGVQACLGQCLDLDLAVEGGAGMGGSKEGNVSAWCIDNAAATFLVCSASEGTPSGPALDIRSPMGIAPLSLESGPSSTSSTSTSKAASATTRSGAGRASMSAQHSYRNFKAAREALMQKSGQHRQRTQAVDFRRVWWDRGIKAGTQAGLSIWRPVPPAGYVSLGDCLGSGYDPPRSVTVLLDTPAGPGMQLLKPADGFEMVWMDESVPPEKCLSLWKPRAPARYAAMGVIASIGTSPPDPHLTRCVREGEIEFHEARGLSPSAVLKENGRRLRLACWLADERLGTFSTTIGEPSGGGRGKGHEKERAPAMLRLHLLNREEEMTQHHPSAQGGGMNVVVRAGATSILVRDALRRPLAELELGALQCSICWLSSSLCQAYLGVAVGIWSFNAPVGAWEPMLEPWNLILNADINTSQQAANGVTPGAHLHLKSTSEMMRLTVAYAAVGNFLRALLEWRDLHAAGAGDAYRRQLAAADASSLHTLVDNALGVPAQLQLDFGDHIAMEELAAGKVTPMLQPLPKPPLRHTQRHALPAQALPPPLLLLDVVRMHCTGSIGGSSASVSGQRELLVTISLQSGELDTGAAPASTRAVTLKDGNVIEWKERLLLTLPTNSGADAAVKVNVEVIDVAGDAGKGCTVAQGTFEASPPDWPGLAPLIVKLQGANAQVAGRKAEVSKLEGGLARVQQWHMEAAGPSDSWLNKGSTAGQRAIRIGSEGPWLAVPSTALQPTSMSKHSPGQNVKASAVVPIRALALGGCALESSFQGGVKREQLRGLCQATGPVEEDLFENERFILLRGWSGSNLLPTERKRFSRAGSSFPEFPRVPLPDGWEWDGQWEVEKRGHVDNDGWAYFADFSTARYPPPQGAQKRSLVDFTRRRRIVRRRNPVPVPVPQQQAQQQQKRQRTAGSDGQRQVVGVVQPGESLPLPPGWRSSDKQLHLRPCKAGDESSATHEWSVMSGDGERQMTLHALDEAQSCLATCAPSAASRGQGSLMDADIGQGIGGAVAASQAVFSITVEGDLLADSASARASAEPLTDWRLVVAPALVVHNLLPVKGTFMVWQKPEGSNLKLCQSGQVGSGEKAHVYAASVQCPVSLQFYPEGYEWAEAEPLPLWYGTSSDQAGAYHDDELPDSFNVTPVSGGSRSPQLILLHREVDMDAWVLEANDDYRSPGLAVAAGLPLEVRLLVPLWVVNSTALPIGVGITDMAPQQPAKQTPEASAQQRSLLDATGIDMPVLDACLEASREGLREVRQVMANSVSMVGYRMPQLQALNTGQNNQQHGIRLKVGESGWTESIPLEKKADQLNTKAVLIRARIPSWGTKHEIVARLELVGGGFARTMALHLEQYIMISNYTGVPLQLKQYSDRQSEQPGRQAVALGLPRASPSAPRGQPGLKEAAYDPNVDHTQALELPAGACGVPLAWSLKTAQRSLSVRIKPGSLASSSAPAWSLPMAAEWPEGRLRFVTLPVVEEASSAGQDAGPSYVQRMRGLLSTEEPASDPAIRRVSRHIKHYSQAQGIQDRPAVILRFRVVMRSTGSKHIILESVSLRPPFLLENRSANATRYRQSGVEQLPWQLLPAFSAAPYAWQAELAKPSGSSGHKVDLQAADGSSPVTAYDLSPGSRSLAGQGAGAGAAQLAQVPGREHLPQLAIGPLRLKASVKQLEKEVMVGAAIRAVGGGAILGRAIPYRVLRLTPGAGTDFLEQRHIGTATVTEENPSTAFYLIVEVTALEVSLVDHSPEELLAASLFGLRLEYAAGIGPEKDFVSYRMSLDSAQLDDEQASTRFPVVFRPAPVPAEAGGLEVLPLVSLLAISQKAGPRGQAHYPVLSFRVTRPLLIAVAETMVWRTAGMIERLNFGALSAAADGQEVTSTDMPVQISLAACSDLTASVSFRGDQTARPRRVASQMGALSWALDLANFENVPVQLHGFEKEHLFMQWSMFLAEIFNIIKGQLVGVAISFLTNFGLLKGASGALGVLSAGVGALAGDAAAQRREARADRQIGGMGQGFLEGGSALGQGVWQGFSGLVSKPMQGAQSGGAMGFVRGLGQGIVGVAADPMSGMLDFMSSAFEGVDAWSAALIRSHRAADAQRARLPRAIGGDRRLLPFQRPDGSGGVSDKEARVEALGQALLRRCAEGSVSALGILHMRGRRARVSADAYEEHFILKGEVVVLLTNRRLLCLTAPGFAALHERVERSSVPVPMAEIPTAELRWAVEWQDLLSLEIKDRVAHKHPKDVLHAHPKDTRPPNRLVVHRKGISGEGDLAHELHCKSTHAQAQELKAVALRVRDKFAATPADSLEWAERYAETVQPCDRSLGQQQVPETMPSMDYQLLWKSVQDSDGNAVSVWRPIGPPGFRPVGDVAAIGGSKPVDPVQVLRDDSPRTDRRQPPDGSLAQPRTVHPAEYHLVWREPTPDGVTVWEPVAPQGYCPMGACVSSTAAAPALDAVVCVRADCAQRVGLYDSPMWALDPQALQGGLALQQTPGYSPEAWKVSIWPIDSPSRTFVAVRSLQKPPSGSVFSVK